MIEDIAMMMPLTFWTLVLAGVLIGGCLATGVGLIASAVKELEELRLQRYDDLDAEDPREHVGLIDTYSKFNGYQR